MLNTTSKSMRNDPLFLRNTFNGTGKWGIPLVRKQLIDLDNPCLIACSDTKLHDNEEHRRFGVHFFVDDYRFWRIYDHPEKSLNRYSQYAFLLTPDFSTFADMNPWRQLESVAKNRWVGAYWQSKGLTVIPAVSWSTPSSYEYCFDGVEEGSYDKNHYLVREIAYHPEPNINNGNQKDNVLHVHDYPVRNDFRVRPPHKITKEEYYKYRKYFKGVPKIEKW